MYTVFTLSPKKFSIESYIISVVLYGGVHKMLRVKHNDNMVVDL